MGNAVSSIYFAALVSGLCVFLAGGSAFIRGRNRTISLFLVAHASVFIVIGLNSLPFFKQMGGIAFGQPSLAVLLGRILAICVFLYAFPALSASLHGSAGPGSASKRLFALQAIPYLVAVVFIIPFAGSRERIAESLGVVTRIGFVHGSIAVAVSGFVAILDRKRENSGRNRFASRMLGIVSVVSFPGFIAQTLAPAIKFGAAKGIEGIILYGSLPLFFIALNVGILVFFINFSFFSFKAEALGERSAVSGADGFKERFEEFGVSAREREVAELLFAGKKYREIADTLCISTDTVKTHVRNLYRKTGASGKMGLYNAIKER